MQNAKCRMQNFQKKMQNVKFTKKGDPKVALKIVSANLLLLQELRNRRERLADANTLLNAQWSKRTL